MKLTVLGNNGPFPAANGACSGYLVQGGGALMQMDMGTGTLAALTALTEPAELDAVLLSHWHFDHCSDLLPLIYRMEGLVAAGHAPLRLWGPMDEHSAVRRIAEGSKAFELHTIAPGDAFAVGGLQVKVSAARHPVPAVMFRITDGCGTLCYTGDTNTVEGLGDFVRDADLLLADGLFTNALWAEQKPHLSASLCAGLARDHGVKRLVITHLNPSIDEQTLLREAREAFPAVELSRRSAVYTL